MNHFRQIPAKMALLAVVSSHGARSRCIPAFSLAVSRSLLYYLLHHSLLVRACNRAHDLQLIRDTGMLALAGVPVHLEHQFPRNPSCKYPQSVSDVKVLACRDGLEQNGAATRTSFVTSLVPRHRLLLRRFPGTADRCCVCGPCSSALAGSISRYSRRGSCAVVTGPDSNILVQSAPLRALFLALPFCCRP